MKKGLGVIVASKNKNGGLTTDSIVACDARFFSISTPAILQDSNFAKISKDRILYVCGHGSKKKQTISGYRMDEIAQMFVEAKYTGQQKIVIASCYGLHKRHGSNMADLLKAAFNKLGIECECEALAEGTSFVWESDNEVLCNSVRFNKVFTSICMKIQEHFIKNTFEPNSTTLNHDFKVRSSDVSTWNKNVASGKLRFSFECVSQLALLCYAVAFTLIYLLINTFIFPIDITSGIPIILMWVAAEFFCLAGSPLGIIAWLPVLVAGFSSHPILLGLRLILSVVLAVIGIFIIFKKQGYHSI